jgi:YHS domain-containing protein
MSVFAQNQSKMKKNYRAVPANQAQIVQQGETKLFCNVCGMTLPMFYKTNHAADIDGKTYQYCSIHCAHEDAMKKAKEATNMKVVDNTSLKFIDVNSAYYVVGSNKPATMSMVSKYAFATKKAAQDFASQFGGKIMQFKELSEEVKAGLSAQIAMIKKKQHKMAMMGQKIYKKMCKATDKRFQSPALAKAYIQQNMLCGKLKGKPLQQVGLFLAGK